MSTAAEALELWRGAWIPRAEFERRLPDLERQLAEDRGRTLDMDALLFASDRLALGIERGSRSELKEALLDAGISPGEADATLQRVAGSLRREHLEDRLVRELGSVRPQEIVRFDLRRPHFEGWAPLGALAHLAPEDDPAAAALSVVEGLLAGNINLLSCSGRSSAFPRALLWALLAEDPTGHLAPFVHAWSLPPSRRDLLAALLAQADGVVAWGEGAAREARELSPPEARLVIWGQRAPFAVVTPPRFEDDSVLLGLVEDLCRSNQPSIDGPRFCFLDTEDGAAAEAWARRLVDVLARATPERPFQVQVDAAPEVQLTPRERTLRVKLLPRRRLLGRLRPLRSSLGTASLACGLEELGELSTLLVRAGVDRIVAPGHARDSYPGEPVLGAHVLQRYSRRVAVSPGGRAATLSSLAELVEPSPAVLAPGTPVLTKAAFQELTFDSGVAQVYFKSGGSTAAPTLSAFTYRDYEDQMRAMAEGLLAAGVDPTSDRCANLFYSGNLYGSFLSFFSILEHLGAVQLPFTALPDYDVVAEAILRNRTNALLGISSYIVQLMRTQADLFKADPVVKKIFYAGEHMGKVQAEHLRREFGVEVIRSACYGSNDAGPLGFACPHCEGGVHHLLSKSQHLEILEMDEDAPVEGAEVGRLIFTSRLRRAQRVERYEIGDLGRWVPGPCPCGRSQPRFELLGRFGDAFKVAAHFFNYRKLTHVLEERLGYSGMLQVRIVHRGIRELMTLRIEEGSPFTAEEVLGWLVKDDDNFRDATETIRVMDAEVEFAPPSAFVRSAQSGKLRPILDER